MKHDTLTGYDLRTDEKLRPMKAIRLLKCTLWPDIESLFRVLGAEITEGRGSRLCVALNHQRMVIHRPHPERIAGKAMVE